MRDPKGVRLGLVLSLPLLLLAALFRLLPAPAAAQPDFGYGFNVAEWDVAQLQAMGFNWMKVFNGPGSRLPVNILLRVEANVSHFNDLPAFGAFIEQLAQEQQGYVEAYEIGNEPNLDADYGWAAPPNAADYAAVLCEAYGRIKAVDPDVLVVSAGLAPTGRVQGDWNGHPGHNGAFQDEREFFLEFVAAGGGDCLDVVGYHPYGYSADYDAAPDLPSADPAQNCANGFCFRGAEKLYELMQANGLAGAPMWATEFGWITEPPAGCLDDPGWQGRLWQIVSEQKQADNLVGAYEYATAHWPWMGAMFIFNLNFNTAPWIPDECEQMRFYSVSGRPAQPALAAMPKVSGPAGGELAFWPLAVTAVLTPGQLPFTSTAVLHLQNSGIMPLTYTLAAETGQPLTVTTALTQGVLAPDAATAVTLTLTLSNQPSGTYGHTLALISDSVGVTETQTLPVTVHVWADIHRAYLPLLARP